MQNDLNFASIYGQTIQDASLSDAFYKKLLENTFHQYFSLINLHIKFLCDI